MNVGNHGETTDRIRPGWRFDDLMVSTEADVEEYWHPGWWPVSPL